MRYLADLNDRDIVADLRVVSAIGTPGKVSSVTTPFPKTKWVTIQWENGNVSDFPLDWERNDPKVRLERNEPKVRLDA